MNNNNFGRTLIAALSEFVGTLFLTLVALAVPPPETAFALGLALTVLVYTIGDISGCHLNPAVTVGLVSIRQFPLGEGLAYIVAQVAGALVARVLVSQELVGSLDAYESAGAVAEFIGVGILMLAVAAVTENKVPRAGSGIAIGGALAAGLLMTNGILNPAVALAMDQGASPAVWASLLGAAAFAALFVLLKKGAPPKPS
jgi:aquaporin Z